MHLVWSPSAPFTTLHSLIPSPPNTPTASPYSAVLSSSPPALLGKDWAACAPELTEGFPHPRSPSQALTHSAPDPRPNPTAGGFVEAVEAVPVKEV